jgi:hypothetical protein
MSYANIEFDNASRGGFWYEPVADTNGWNHHRCARREFVLGWLDPAAMGDSPMVQKKVQ